MIDLSWNNILKFFKRKDFQNLFFDIELENDKLKSKLIDNLRKYVELSKEIEGRLDQKKRNLKIRKIDELASKLWEQLMIHSLITLDFADYFTLEELNEKKKEIQRSAEFDLNILEGVREIKQYLDKFRSFEYHLYASDTFYRDHYYHMLEFYIYGLFLLNREWNGNGNASLMHEIDENAQWFCEPLTEKGYYNLDKKELSILHQVRNASFCVIALSHDLGYPIEKLHQINRSLSGTIEHFPYLDFLPYHVTSPETASGIIEFLLDRLSETGQPDKHISTDRFIYSDQQELKYFEEVDNPFRNGKARYVHFPNGYRVSKHTRAHFSKLLSEKKHGILSCLILIDKLHRFRGNPYEEGIDSKYNKTRLLKEHLTSLYILKPIAYHQGIAANPAKNEYLYSNIVFMVDEIVESGRLSRSGGHSILPQDVKVRINWSRLNYIELEFRIEPDLEIDEVKKIAWYKYQSFITKYIRTIGPCMGIHFKVTGNNSARFEYTFSVEINSKKENEMKITFKIIDDDKDIIEFSMNNSIWIERSQLIFSNEWKILEKSNTYEELKKNIRQLETEEMNTGDVGLILFYLSKIVIEKERPYIEEMVKEGFRNEKWWQAQLAAQAILKNIRVDVERDNIDLVIEKKKIELKVVGPTPSDRFGKSIWNDYVNKAKAKGNDYLMILMARWSHKGKLGGTKYYYKGVGKDLWKIMKNNLGEKHPKWAFPKGKEEPYSKENDIDIAVGLWKLY